MELVYSFSNYCAWSAKAGWSKTPSFQQDALKISILYLVLHRYIMFCWHLKFYMLEIVMDNRLPLQFHLWLIMCYLSSPIFCAWLKWDKYFLTVIRLVYSVHSRNCLGIEVIACVYWVFVTNTRIVHIGLVAAIGYKDWLKTWWMFKRLCWYPWNKPVPALNVSNVRVQSIQCHNKDNLSYSINACKASEKLLWTFVLLDFFLKPKKDWFFLLHTDNTALSSTEV